MKLSTITLTLSIIMFVLYGVTEKIDVLIAASCFLIVGNLQEIQEKL